MRWLTKGAGQQALSFFFLPRGRHTLLFFVVSQLALAIVATLLRRLPLSLANDVPGAVACMFSFSHYNISSGKLFALFRVI